MPLSHTDSPRGAEMILLLDADPATRKLAAFMLEKQGYTVLEARNRAEALALFDRPDLNVELLLLEAKGRGSELAEELQRSQPQARVLFMCDDSARGARLVVEQGRPFLKKPFTMAEIASKVRDVLDAPREKTMTAGDSF
jgi:DNA-binding response OmpR family regulator